MQSKTVQMKKHHIFPLSAFALLSLLALSCVREAEEFVPGGKSTEEQVDPSQQPVFTASTEDVDKSKVSLDGYSVVWAAGDEISISDNKGHNAVYKADSDGSSVSFSYKSGSSLSSGSDVIYTAWYPAGCASGYISGAQTWVENGIHDIPMKAVSSTTDLNFKNLSGIVKVHLQGPHSNICALVLAADKPLSGTFNTSINPGTPAIVSGTGTVQITIPSGSGRNINGGKDYYFAVASGNYDDFYLAVLNADGELAYYNGSGISVNRSKITGIGPVQVQSMGNSETVNLTPSTETANCYIVDLKRDYKFRATVKGNSASAISPVSADIIWSDGPVTGQFGVIRPVILYDGCIWFRKDNNTDSYRPGNALVAARDASGNILWSWHLWATENLSNSTWTGNSIKMMDRNLGAWSASAGNAGATGLFYQWGRKDPFPQIRTTSFPEAIASSSAVGNQSYAVAHPSQWIFGTEETGYDWSYTVQDGSAWNGGTKGLYDPCPPGWKLPEGAGHGISGAARGSTPITLSGFWPVAFGTGVGFCGKDADNTSWWDASSVGMIVPAAKAGTASWFPATGYFAAESGELVAAGSEGSLWTRGSEPVMGAIAASSYCLCFGNGRVCPAAMSGRAAGRSVRCVKL